MSQRDDDSKYAEQTAMLKQHFDPVFTEPIPARMYLRQPAWIGMTRAAAVFVAGLAVGLATTQLRPAATPAAVALQMPPIAVRAARAHAVYASEVRHPVEVDASQQEHLVKWLSKRLGLDLKIPVLASEGFELLGGRLLPGPDGGAVAQFMYQDAAGKRLTLYVSRRNLSEPLTEFRFAKEGPLSVFYWIDHECGYALSGDIDQPTLARIANAVYHQLEG